MMYNMMYKDWSVQMSRMIRKQIYLEPQQDKLLKDRSRELGVSEAEVIRRCIELAGQEPLQRVPDREAWEDEMEFIRQRLAMDVPQTGRSWTREDLYDGRLDRYSR